MKNQLKLLMVILLMTTGLMAFAQENSEAAKARKELKEAQADLREAKIDSAADYRKFREEAERIILDNQYKIKVLKEQKASENKETKEKYDKKVLALQVKNDAWRKRITTSDKTKSSKWSAFKREFNHDMEELGKAFKDIAVDNSN
jgi:hypothetical protein